MIRYMGYVAGVLTVASFLPQVLRSWRTRQTRDLSLGMLMLLTTASAMWMFYGLLTKDLPLIITNAGMVAMASALVVAKIRFT